MLLQFVRTIARCPESSVGCPSVREGENGGVGFVNSPIPSVLAVMGDCKIQRGGNVMSFCTVKFFYSTQTTLHHPLTGLTKSEKILPGNPSTPMLLTAQS